jgi:hypothetical protein
MRIGARHVGAAIAGVVILMTPFLRGQTASRDGVLLIRMPDETALPTDPSDADIARFVAARGSHLQMTAQDVQRDRAFARQVLGQRQIFEELAAFHARENIPARVRFIAWADAFRFFADYVSDRSNPPIVAQIGDTWAAYFRSLGVVADERRHTWDVRVLWYWKDMVTERELADGDRFSAACRRLHDAPPPGLIAPLAIPTAPDWNLLHDLSVWLYNGGVPTLISIEKKFGLLPWKEAVFAGPEGERAVEFLIHLARRGYVALPEKRSLELADDFLARKYAMMIAGPWLTKLAEKALGSEWRTWIGAMLPPRIGSTTAVTMKGGSLLVVLDPTRGRDPEAVRRARRLIEFFSSRESQQRYTEALGALPANEEALETSPYFDLFQSALEHGRTYPQIPEWAPVVENLATRDNLYAFWKRLSVLTDTHATASEAEQAARARLILAALHSAEADINRELSPGRLALLWPWVLALAALVAAVAVLALWHRHVERRRIAELRQTRDLLATLERRLASTEEAVKNTLTPSASEMATVATKGYPALYLDAAQRKVSLRRSPAHPLEEVLHGAEYDLFRHLIECLQAGWQQTHWIWSYIVWPTAQPKFPKEAFATHCTKLRKKIETVWQLGPVLGRGDRRTGAIPIEVKDAHFYTDAAPDGTAYPLWALFRTSEQAARAYKTGSWKTAQREIETLLRMDPENWLGNTLLCHLALQGHVAITDPLVQKALTFVHVQKVHYERALERIEALPAEKVDLQQMERVRSRCEALRLIASSVPPSSLPTSPVNERSPWRDRERLKAWLTYLDEGTPGLPDEEIKTIRGIQRFLRQRLPWASPSDVDEQFRSFLQDIVCDSASWPEERLPRSRRAFQSGALDYALARLYGLRDDAESKAITKAQNLRKLWDRRSQLRKALQQDPTVEQLYTACQERYGWSRAFFERVLELERLGQLRSWDERSSRRVM